MAERNTTNKTPCGLEESFMEQRSPHCRRKKQERTPWGLEESIMEHEQGHPTCNPKCMHGSTLRNRLVASIPSRDIPEWVDSYKFVNAVVCTRWHKLLVILLRWWPHAWASARVCQSEVLLFRNFSVIHTKLHEEVLTPRTILPLLLAFRSVRPPALASIVVVTLELLQEPLHTGLADNLNIAKVAHQNFVACLNVRSGRCLWVIGQTFLEPM